MSLSLEDLGDRLSPILVKELRQGLKSKGFITAFIASQLGLVLSIGIALGQDADAWESSDALFWTCAIAITGVLLPLSGINALANEQKANTLELLLLTRLSAWRITFGKWASLVVQAVLLSTTFLPYLVLRYYLGGVDIGADALLLLTVMVSAVTVSAFAIALSSIKTPALRGVSIVIVLWGGGAVLSTMAMMTRGGVGSGMPVLFGWRAGAFWLLSVGAWAALVALMLEVAASRIAPLAENHALRKRSLALALLALSAVPGVCGLGPDVAMPGAVTAILLGSLSVIDACCEPPVALPSVLEPFRRFGPLAAIPARFFLPGWASGAWYTVLFALGSAGALISAGRDPAGAFLLAGALATLALVPLVLAVGLGVALKHQPLAYLVSAVYNVIGLVAVSILDSLGGSWLREDSWTVVLFPILAVGWGLFKGTSGGWLPAVSMLGLAVAALLVLSARSLSYWRSVHGRLSRKASDGALAGPG